MAHGLTNFDGMFSVREKPWHGLGVILPELATAREAIDAAKLDWTVEKQPCFYVNRVGEYTQIPGKFAIVRTDVDIAFTGGVGEQYTPLQNKDAFNFMDAICQDPGGPKYVTAGSLHEGRKVWLLVKMPSFVQVSKTDVVEEFLLLSNSHDGSRAVEIMWTPIRVVCQNTLNMALGSNKPGRVTLRHTSRLMGKIEGVQDLLGICRAKHDEFEDIVQAMKSYEPTKADIDDVCRKLMGVGFAASAQKNVDKYRDAVEETFRNGEANTAAGDTSSAWALYNGITEYADYGRPMRGGSEDSRLDRAWFGTSANLKARALVEVGNLVMR